MSFYKELPKRSGSEFFQDKKTKSADDTAYYNNPVYSRKLYKEFLKDWNKLRVRHKGQKAILNAIFKLKKKYIFARIGRKGAKTTTNIDIAWRVAHLHPRSTIFICCPTITQAVEIYWDEKRIQWCDIDNPSMQEKYISSIDNRLHIVHFKNGSNIKLVGTWNEARGRGTQPNVFICDEVQDASAEYLDAMEPNLAAKADAICVMTGTPPKKRNHYHEWEARIKKNLKGFHCSYSSYVNVALPHLNEWLNNKRAELIEAGKEDIWLREYMAEDCFRSDDRILPDISLVNWESMIGNLRSVDAQAYEPTFGLYITEHQVTGTFSVRLASRYTGTKIYTLETYHIKRLWDRSYEDIYAKMKEKMEEYSAIFKRPWRKVVLDETNSFGDVVTGITYAKNDKNWLKRGIPLLKEMLISKNLSVSTKASEFAINSQNLLKDDDLADYPTICAMAMIVNEFYQSPSLSKPEQFEWDRLAPLREAGIVTIPRKRNQLRPYRGR